jgi:xanthine dehydrogenase accessory factor
VTPDPTGRALELLGARTPFCLATVVVSDVPAVAVGHKAVIHEDGRVEGSLGSEPLDRTVSKLAVEQMPREVIAVVRVRTDGTVLPARRGMRDLRLASGVVEVAIDPMLPPPRLVIVGAGHIAVPLARFAKLVGFEVTVIDDRARFASRERFPDADELVVDDFDRAIARQIITARTYLVLVTRGHEHDERALQRVVQSPAPYIGMIGSRRRVLLVFRRLTEQRVPDAFLDRIYAPIGLDIGARSPEEIALAIMAEVINVRRGGRGESLALRRRQRRYGTRDGRSRPSLPSPGGQAPADRAAEPEVDGVASSV